MDNQDAPWGWDLVGSRVDIRAERIGTSEKRPTTQVTDRRPKTEGTGSESGGRNAKGSRRFGGLVGVRLTWA